MSNGATYSVVPFINRQSVGAVAGIVGAGGNAGAVFAGFLLKTKGLDWHTALFILGAMVTSCSFLSFAVTSRDDPELSRETISHRHLDSHAMEPMGVVA
jgi:NNP family nitrate/nitrite transporter-like MFS transporter